ncbi:hypothetical protein CupriaWKF_08510 [Cupriavidus sp. WKF15]|nr:hypothetical protein [Cupriavidus sp. WKF15]WER47567.1 hypothetical protein CupriaWKF_08510 [Cupriavidus sp. WKF15]
MNARLAYLIAVLAATLAAVFLAGEPDVFQDDNATGIPDLFLSAQ